MSDFDKTVGAAAAAISKKYAGEIEVVHDLIAALQTVRESFDTKHQAGCAPDTVPSDAVAVIEYASITYVSGVLDTAIMVLEQI